jgi:hypothetical protein
MGDHKARESTLETLANILISQSILDKTDDIMCFNFFLIMAYDSVET